MFWKMVMTLLKFFLVMNARGESGCVFMLNVMGQVAGAKFAVCDSFC